MDKITQDRIQQDAADFAGHKANSYHGYIAGATAENERAQNLADTLEWIKTYGPCDSLTVKFIDKALLKWKDGKGKEAVCTCSLQQLAAHGECHKCPGQHTRHEITNPTK